MQNLFEILKSRLLVFDGTMDTMIQDYNFSESFYRGSRLKDNFQLKEVGVEWRTQQIKELKNMENFFYRTVQLVKL